MPALVRLATTLAALAVARVAARRALERASVRRLPRAPDGIVRGAEPLDLQGAPDAPAVLLVHGFGDTPQSLAGLARRLHADEGWTVRVPLLPGHGRSLRDFARTGADDWLACARAEWRALRARHPNAALVGQSMGGALAAVLAAETPGLPALVLLAPYLAPGPGLRRLVQMRHLVDALWPYVPSGGTKSIHDPEARRAALSYGALTGRLARELESVVLRARRALGAIAAPTLVVQSRGDNRTPADAAEAAFAAIGAREKSLVWLEGCGHVVSVDRERERVVALTAAWLARARDAGRPAGGALPAESLA
jgi:carboxylesterase